MKFSTTPAAMLLKQEINKLPGFLHPASSGLHINTYWVESQNILDVMLKCVTEVPVLVFGK